MVRYRLPAVIFVLLMSFACRSQTDIVLDGRVRTLYGSTKSFGDCIPKRPQIFSENKKVNTNILQKVNQITQDIVLVENHPKCVQLERYKQKLKTYNIILEDINETDGNRAYTLGLLLVADRYLSLYTQIVLNVNLTVEHEIINTYIKIAECENQMQHYSWERSHYGNQYVQKTVQKKVNDGYETVTTTRDGKTYTVTKPKYRYETETVTEPNPNYNPQLAEKAQKELNKWGKIKVRLSETLIENFGKLLTWEQTVKNKKIDWEQLNNQ